MRKKILSILLSGALVLSSMVFASAQEAGAGNGGTDPGTRTAVPRAAGCGGK